MTRLPHRMNFTIGVQANSCRNRVPPMRRNTLLAALFISLVTARAFAADDFKPEAGFVSLFNGADLTGWCYREGDKAEAGVAAKFDGKSDSSDARFSGKDGVLTVHPKSPRRIEKIWTQKLFPKDFVLRLEFRAEVNADSGIYVRGPQLQCRDYLVAGPYKDLKKYRAQDWNEIEIVVKDGIAHCTCNGELLTDAMKVPVIGPIGFEGDRGQMEYRHIRLKEAP
jgi:hypothetical protein